MKVDEVARLLGVPFHAQQRAAISAPPEAPLQIVAGAGAGKTTVMAARIVWLVGGGHLLPEQVLGLTFTNKAAAALAVKVRTSLEALGGAELAGEPTVSTYHAYAGRLVAEHGLRVAVEPGARLLADASRFQLAGQVMRRYRLPLPALDKAPRTVLAALVDLDADCADHLVCPADVRVADLVLAAELDARADGVGTDRGNKGWHDDLRQCAAASRARADLCLLVQAYRDAKRERDLADFGDQIATAVRIAAACPEVVQAERGRYRAVLLDEYQDTSVAQRLLLAELFGGGHPVTAVGDPCQAIYGWRGASVANLIDFPRHFPRADGAAAARLSLSVSQRNGGRLLRLANVLSEDLRGRHAVEELTAPVERQDVGEVVVARWERADEELVWLARTLRDELARPGGPSPGEVAVLLRTWRRAGAIHAALTAVGIAVEVVGLGGLLSLPEVADIVATLEVLDDPTANPAVIRLLTGPRWMLGLRDLRALGVHARRLAGDASDGGTDELNALAEAASGADPCDVVALADALDDLAGRVPGEPRPAALSDEGALRCAALGRELRALRRRVSEPLVDLVGRVIAVTGLDVEAAADPSAVAARRRESLASFLDVVAGWSALDGEASLRALLAYLHASDEYDRGFDSSQPGDGNAVQILTVHKAKGLEWDVVALPELIDTVFPSTRSGSRWPTSFGELPTRHRQDAEALPAAPDWSEKKGLGAFVDGCKRHARLEEDRLAYVAVTRARRLVIGSGHLWGPTQSKPRAPSPYLLALRDHAEAGYGRVDAWVDDSADERNPYLTGASVGWPPALDPAGLAVRTAAAQAVATAMADPQGAATAADAELTEAERVVFAAYDSELVALLGEAARGRASEVVVPLPAVLSASQVLRLHQDPDGLARELARPLPRRPIHAASRGTAFHSWVEQHFSVPPLLDPDDLAGAADADLDDQDLARLQRAFLDGPWANRVPYAVEAPFAIVLGGRVVRGRIDAVYDDGAATTPRWHVVDWKTGSGSADPLQLAVYRSAWATLQGCPDDHVRASFCTVATGELRAPPLMGRGELEQLLSEGSR